MIGDDDDAAMGLRLGSGGGSGEPTETHHCEACNKKLTNAEVLACKRDHVAFTCDEEWCIC